MGAVECKPFVKWAGGKTLLLPELVKRVPEHFGTYREPFVGGGALFFHLRPESAVLTDMNKDLIAAYYAVRECPAALIESLRKKAAAHSKEFYYEQRAADPAGYLNRASRLIYLNKTCFNGLYRVNKRGEFNVPIGSYKNPNVCDDGNISACSQLLLNMNVGLGCEDFRLAGDRAVAGDFVYFDPPYVPLSATSSFGAYTSDGFGIEQQVALRDLALKLRDRGVHVLVSNSSSPIVEDLYGKDFKVEKVFVRRNINSKGTSRGAVGEYLIS